MKKLILIFCLFPLISNAQQWMDVGGGVYCTYSLYAGGVVSMYVYNDELWCYGGYDIAGSQNINRIAKWNGSTWQAIYPGLSNDWGDIYTFQKHNDGKLYLGGNFGNNGNWNWGNCISRWNGSMWENFSPLVSTLTYKIESMATYKGKLYVGGPFNTISGVSVKRIACWDSINGWQDVGGGVDGSIPDVSALTVYNDELIAAGAFYSAGDKHAWGIARWNGYEWNPVGKLGIYGYNGGGGIASMVVDTLRGFLYAAGGILWADGDTGRIITQWNGNKWTFICHYSSIGGGAPRLCMYHDELYVSAINPYVLPSGDTIHGIMKWNGKDWSPVGRLDAFADGTAGCGSRMTVYHDTLYAGAPTCLIANDSMPIHNIACWYTPPDTSCNVLLNNFNKILVQDTTYFCDTIKVDLYSNVSYADSLLWNFGDGKTDTTQAPTHVYNNSGTYNVSLIAYYKYCTDTVYATLTTLPCDSLHPVIYGAEDTIYMQEDTYGTWYAQPIFYSNTPKADYWWWDFGNGTQDSSNIFSTGGSNNVYLAQGTFIITLIVINDCCIDTVYDTIVVVKPTGLEEINSTEEKYLWQNIPNPFDNTTSIPYYVPYSSIGFLKITNAKGELVDEYALQQGKNTLSVSLDYLRSGTYFYSIIIDGILKGTRKMIIE